MPLFVTIAGVVCCSLLALYFLWLATLHRRFRPTVVSGQAEFAATLAGLSGFLVVGAVLAGAAGQAASAARPAESFEVAWERVVTGGGWRLAGTGLFLAAVGTAAAVGMWTRRDSLEVHHIDPDALPAAVADAAASVGLGVSHSVSWTYWPVAGQASVLVRRLDPAATDELLEALADRLRAAPSSTRSAGGWYTAVACGLLGCTLALFVAFFRQTRMI